MRSAMVTWIADLVSAATYLGATVSSDAIYPHGNPPQKYSSIEAAVEALLDGEAFVSCLAVPSRDPVASPRSSSGLTDNPLLSAAFPSKSSGDEPQQLFGPPQPRRAEMGRPSCPGEPTSAQRTVKSGMANATREHGGNCSH